MTPELEKRKTEEYRNRIAEALQRGTEEGYRELETICEERNYDYLATRNKELLLFRRIILVWLAERRVNKPIGETIIGRAAAFMDISLSELTMKQLIETYTFVKFAMFRLEDGLPESECIEGVTRVMFLGVSPEALILTARMEVEKERKVLEAYADVLTHQIVRDEFPQAAQLETVLREYLAWDGR